MSVLGAALVVAGAAAETSISGMKGGELSVTLERILSQADSNQVGSDADSDKAGALAPSDRSLDLDPSSLGWPTLLAKSVPKISRRLGLLRDDDGGDQCGADVQATYNCTDHACEDLVPGENE